MRKRIRTQLAWMMVAVVAPLVLLAGGFTYALADVQRDLQMQGILERVRALRLALDTEINGTVRLLRILAGRAELAVAARPSAAELQEPLQRILRQEPRWSSVAVIESDGTEAAHIDSAPQSPAPVLDAATRQQVLQTRKAAVSGLVSSADGRAHVTFVAAPVLQGEQVLRVVAVSIPHTDWLALLRSHPVGDGATLGLTDQNGLIVARTLNPERSVGRRASPEFIQRSGARGEGTFVNLGLEGQRFYSAYSRLNNVPWILGTGVPAERIEAALWRQSLLLAAGVALAALIATMVALLLRRRILTALNSLADVQALRRAATSSNAPPLAFREAEQVRQLLRDTLQAEARARAEAEQARAQADAANRGKDDFLAMMAHELRNPLSAMSTAVALLEAPKATPQTDLRARDVLRRQVQQMTRMVDDLLDAARVARGSLHLELQPVDLAQLVQQVVQTFDAGGRTRHLQVELSLQPAVVQGDPLRLEQVVSNLLDNATKFSAAGGHVRVTLQVADGQAELSLADDGVGMDPGLLSRLFDPYTQGNPGIDRGRGGLGLGLHVVRRLVELHGGSVVAHSAGLGQGARFTVRLPLSAQAPAGPTQQHQQGALPPLRVVLVEDNPDVREAVAALLRMGGHQALSAADGAAGLALLRQERPDVALVDLGLPGMDGMALARALRQGGDAPSTVLLALTAYGDERTRAQALQAGFDGFLRKPFELREFEITLAEARARRRSAA